MGAGCENLPYLKGGDESYEGNNNKEMVTSFWNILPYGRMDIDRFVPSCDDYLILYNFPLF